MNVLLPGQNAPLAGGSVEVSVTFGGPVTVDVSAYLLDAGGKVGGDGDMVFFNQSVDASGAVSMSPLPGNGSMVSIDLSRVPARVERVAVCAAVDAAASPGGTMSRAGPIEVSVAGCRFVPVPERTDITALTLVEIYRRNGAWKVRAVGAGFAGGLGPLSKLYGVDVADEPTTPTPRAQPSSPAPPPPPPPPISLSKVSLTKAKPSIDLRKGAGGFGTLAVNLNWNRGTAQKRGFFGGGTRSGGSAVDLDLACLYELEDGEKGAVQALGRRFGALDRAPFVKLAGDDRSGDSADGEWMHVSGTHWPRIRRILVYAFIYEGVPNWAATDGVVTITVQGQPPIEVRLDEGSGLGTCAIALLENVGGDIRVSREVKYFPESEKMDKAYRWGMRWTTGSK